MELLAEAEADVFALAEADADGDVMALVVGRGVADTTGSVGSKDVKGDAEGVLALHPVAAISATKETIAITMRLFFISFTFPFCFSRNRMCCIPPVHAEKFIFFYNVLPGSHRQKNVSGSCWKTFPLSAPAGAHIVRTAMLPSLPK